MDYRTFQALVEEELRYLAPFDLSDEDELLKAAGALVVLREYLAAELEGGEIDGRRNQPAR